MVICRFYSQGRCKFGDSCRFEHPNAPQGVLRPSQFSGFGGSQSQFGAGHGSDQDANAQNQGYPVKDVLPIIKQEMMIWEKSKMWPFSCFGYAKHIPSLPGMEDLSMEEVRLKAYEANKSGSLVEYQQWIAAQAAEYDRYRKQLQNLDEPIKLHLIQFINEVNNNLKTSQSSASQPSPFSSGNTQSSLFTNTSSSQSSGFGSSSVFGSKSQTAGPSLFGNTAQKPSMFGASAAGGSGPVVFGSSSVFGSSGTGQSSGSAFGAVSSGSVFGASASNSAQTQSSVFGTASTGQSPMFGSASATPGSSVFGATGNVQTPGSSVFGGTNSTQTPGSSLFGGTGNTQAPGSSVFGATGNTQAPGSSVFGATGNTQAPGSSVFSATSNTQTPGSSVFAPTGNTQTPGSSMFGTTTSTQASGPSIFGTTGGTQASGSSVFAASQTAGSVGFGTAVVNQTTSDVLAVTNSSVFGSQQQSGSGDASGQISQSSKPGFGILGSQPQSSQSGFSTVSHSGQSAFSSSAQPTTAQQTQAPTLDKFSFALTSQAQDNTLSSSAASQPIGLFGKPASQTGSAFPSSSSPLDINAYTPLDQLTVLEKEQFEAKEFILDRIPIKAPPRELC